MIKTFSQLKIGDVFWVNGGLYIKQSTRTARPCSLRGLPFYVTREEECQLALDSRYSVIHYADRVEVYFCGEYLFSTESLTKAYMIAAKYESKRLAWCE